MPTACNVGRPPRGGVDKFHVYEGEQVLIVTSEKGIIVRKLKTS